jgi:hypothetical protein
MNIRNHAPTLILRTLWEKPDHKRCEPVPAFDRSCTHPLPQKGGSCFGSQLG